MADNSGTFQSTALASPPAGLNPALRQLTLSGDTAEVQVIVPIAVTGSEGSWTGREYLIQDDTAFTPGTNAVAMMGAEYDDTGPDSVDEGDAGALRMSANRNLYVTIRDAAGNERGLNIDGSGNITVNVTGTVTVGSHAVTNAGTFVVQVDGAALTSLQLIDDGVFTDDTSTHSTGTSKGYGLMAVATPTDSAVDANDFGHLAMSVTRRLHVSLQDFAGTAPVTGSGTATGALRVELPTNGTGVLATVGTVTTVTTVSALGNSTTGPQKAEDVASADADVGIPAMAVRKATPANTSNADGDYEFLQMSAGRLWVDPSGVTLTVASHAVTNAGTFAVQESGTHVQVDDAAFTPATSKVMMVGFEADESSTDSVDEGDGGAARMTLDRKQIVTLQPHTAGGLSVAQLNGADGGGGVLVATAQVIKASAGQLYGYYIYNPNTAATFVHFYNTAAASVTVGTTNPLVSVTIPALSAANMTFPYGVTFSNAGWSAAATTTAGGNTAPSTGLDVTVFYA